MDNVMTVLIVGICMLVPIIKVLVSHQQKMTELLHRQNQPASLPDAARLEQEIRELKSLVHQQAIALDNLSAKIDGSASAVQERVGVNS